MPLKLDKVDTFCQELTREFSDVKIVSAMPKKQGKPPSQRDRGYTNILHHLTKKEDKEKDKTAKIERLLKQIMATQEEAATQLNEVNTKLTKIGTETKTLLEKITALENAASNSDVKPELQAAIDAVKAQAAVVDDLVPDAA